MGVMHFIKKNTHTDFYDVLNLMKLNCTMNHTFCGLLYCFVYTMVTIK